MSCRIRGALIVAFLGLVPILVPIAFVHLQVGDAHAATSARAEVRATVERGIDDPPLSPKAETAADGTPYSSALVGDPALVVLGFFVGFALLLGLQSSLFLLEPSAETTAPTRTGTVGPASRADGPVPPPASPERPTESGASDADFAVFDRLIAPTSDRFAIGATLEVPWRPSPPSTDTAPAPVSDCLAMAPTLEVPWRPSPPQAAATAPPNGDPLAIFDRLVAPVSNRFAIEATLEAPLLERASSSEEAQATGLARPSAGALPSGGSSRRIED